MHKKFEINRTKIKGGCQSGRKGVPHNSMSDLPLALFTACQRLDDSQCKCSYRCEFQVKCDVKLNHSYVLTGKTVKTRAYLLF